MLSSFPQIGVDFALKVINKDPNTTVRLQLWDIAGSYRGGLLGVHRANWQQKREFLPVICPSKRPRPCSSLAGISSLLTRFL